jgi:cold shock CspA family protein
MAVGKVVKFDETRGFGFIAPRGGSEDVFLHVNDLLIPESLVRPGIMVEFDIDEGERGLKASNISLRENDSGSEAPAHVAAAAMARVATATPAGSATAVSPVSSPHIAQTADSPSAANGDEEGFCDLLTTHEFSSQVTELLLAVAPALTGVQVLNIRSKLAEFATCRGWLVP